VAFFAYGYSIPLDTLKKTKCPNGILTQVNGETKYIDTMVQYYPLIEFCDKFELRTFKLKSLNLQLLEEDKWYNEEIREDKLRIFFIEPAPNFDSIVLYSFFKYNHDSIKLIKKEMPVLYYAEDFFNPSDTPLCPVIERSKIVNYKQTDFIISKKNIQKLTKQLNRIKKCETFARFGYADPAFVIEYTFKGNYYLLIASEPKYWSKRFSVNLQSKCPRNSGLKIMRWLKQY
jgi:hypothetical protein